MFTVIFFFSSKVDEAEPSASTLHMWIRSESKLCWSPPLLAVVFPTPPVWVTTFNSVGLADNSLVLCLS